MAPTNLIEITSPEHFTQVMGQDLTRVSLLNFWAPWAEPCEQMNKVVEELAQKWPAVLVLMVSWSCALRVERWSWAAEGR